MDTGKSDSHGAAISAALLRWYDANARTMPWRTGPLAAAQGARPDPYHVWLSEVMLQQTTVAAVTAYFQRFTARWPTVAALAEAEDGTVMAEWAGLGYYARARNLLKCARAVVANHQGRFPQSQAILLTLPGIGPYTAAAIASIAFNQRATVVDGNVERVIARLYAIDTPLPVAKPRLTELAANLTPAIRPGDHAQAMMDLGATICTPRRPSCATCPLTHFCMAHAKAIAPDLPRRLPKAPKPTRHGIAYVARRPDGALLLERRPERGLLGGTLGWPGSDWVEGTPKPAPPCAAHWRAAPTLVTHTFTHFHLILQVMQADLPPGTNPELGQFIQAEAFSPSDLPTLMRKVYHTALIEPEPARI